MILSKNKLKSRNKNVTTSDNDDEEEENSPPQADPKENVVVQFNIKIKHSKALLFKYSFHDRCFGMRI